MRKDILDLYDHPRAKMGWEYLKLLIDYLGNGNTPVTFVYLFKTNDLLITDEKLIKILETLKIPYTYSDPSNSIRFIRSLRKKGK